MEDLGFTPETCATSMSDTAGTREPELEYTSEVRDATVHLYERVKDVIPPFE